MIETIASRAKWQTDHDKAKAQLRGLVLGRQSVKGIADELRRAVVSTIKPVSTTKSNPVSTNRYKDYEARKAQMREAARKRRAQPEQQVPRQDQSVAT